MDNQSLVGKIVTKEDYYGKRRAILVKSIDVKQGFPVVCGKLVKQDEGYDSSKIGADVWCYIDDIMHVETQKSQSVVQE